MINLNTKGKHYYCSVSVNFMKKTLEGRVKCPLLLTPLSKQISSQKTENNHEALQIAQERSDLSSVVHRCLRPENPYKLTQLLAGQYISHHLSPLHRKYCSQTFVNPHHSTFCRKLQYVAGMNSPLQYFIKAMELLCYNRNSQVKNQLLLLHKKYVIQLHQQGGSF